RHVREAAHQSGFAEPWVIVSTTDPVGVVRRLLRPDEWRWDATLHVCHVWGVHKARRRRVATAEQWTGWTIVVHE
ncbi:MAG: hypothetical protein OWQ57_13120, partial [Sulfobacillus sp.]|nr:hypothetical protein [Sulfobacillus sp.]